MKFQNPYEDIKRAKEKRELLNMKLIILVLSKEEEKEIATIRDEIKRLTIIIGDNYQDAYELLKKQIYKTTMKQLNKRITKANAYEQATQIEEYILRQQAINEKEDFDFFILSLLQKYKKIGYKPRKVEKSLSTIKIDTSVINKKDYISEVLFQIKQEEEDQDFTKLEELKNEIDVKAKMNVIKIMKKKNL